MGELSDSLQVQLNTLVAELDAVYNFRSWRITKPLRLAGMVARKIKTRFWHKNFADGKMRAEWKNRRDFSIDPAAFGCEKETLAWQESFVSPCEIKFSVFVPLYNTPEHFLREMIASVLFQTYENWELCLVDGSDAEYTYVQEICERIAGKDKRIKYRILSKNVGISEDTNECMTNGDYWTNFKPNFAPDYFITCNYICHFTSFRRVLLEKTDGFNSECGGAQDYDIFLLLIEATNRIAHVQKCLYYW